MSEQPQPPPGDPNQKPGEQHVTQQVQYSQISARVPERMNRGTFATNPVVLTGNLELVCDFLLRMAPPHMLAARVVLPYTALAPMVQAVNENLENYRARFGTPAAPPAPPPNVVQPNIAEVYDQLKIPEDVAVGAYANTLMISHSATDFCLDFILDLFPRPVVTQRIYMSAGQLPPFLNTLKRTLEGLQQRMAHPPQVQQQKPAAPPSPPPPPPPEPPAQGKGPQTPFAG
jgi:hypothetical protein